MQLGLCKKTAKNIPCLGPFNYLTKMFTFDIFINITICYKAYKMWYFYINHSMQIGIEGFSTGSQNVFRQYFLADGKSERIKYGLKKWKWKNNKQERRTICFLHIESPSWMPIMRQTGFTTLLVLVSNMKKTV